MSKKSKRISVEATGKTLSENPFEGLNLGGLPESKRVIPIKSAAVEGEKKKSRGRIDVSRQKGGRGGKTVTVATGFVGIAAEEKAALAKSIQKRCGVGGGVKQGNIEIQGDKREEVKAALEAARFRVVFVGG